MPQLTDAEKQDVIRYLEADKPLPDKYRFLLFDEKREVELVWNGKTNEVCNIVLPFQTIEQVDEPRAEVGANEIDEDGGLRFPPFGGRGELWEVGAGSHGRQGASDGAENVHAGVQGERGATGNP